MSNPTTTIQNIRLYLIQPSPFNPRKTIDKDALRELADNISRQGLLQPITVRPVDYDVINKDGTSKGVEYEIVCGERRYRACSLLALETIPCIVREMTDEEAFDAMITENLQRRDVDPIEEAEAFRLLQQRGQSVEELALRFGKSERYVRDRIRLVSLAEPLQKALSIGQIPLKGAYLLSRLPADDQQEFFDDQLDGDHETNVTADDVEEWLDRHFRKLHSAPFQEKGNLTEKWNPDGHLIRRCDTCECNTCNHGCLFADMQGDEPQCIDETCYSRKCDIYNEWFVSQYADRIVREGEPAAAGRMHIVAEEPYGDDASKRYNALTESLSQKGYRLFTTKELSPYWGTPDELLKNGEVVEGINLRDLSNGYCVQIRHYRRTKSSGYGQTSQEDQRFMASKLVERAASIEAGAQRKVMKFAREHFDREAYVARQQPLEVWEDYIIAAILFDQMEYADRSTLIPGCSYGVHTYQQIAAFQKDGLVQAQESHSDRRAWMRRAIAAYCAKEQNKDFYIAMTSRVSAEVGSYAFETQQEAQQRIDTIHEELKEMGFDENGNKL